MFRKLTLTAAAVSLIAASPALAFPFGKKSPKAPETTAAARPAAAAP